MIDSDFTPALAVAAAKRSLEQRQAQMIARLTAALRRIADDDVEPDLKGRADILSGIAYAALIAEERSDG